MKVKNKKDVAIKCPFWIGYAENGQEIICEGPDKDNKIHLTFENKSRLQEYRKRFCYSIEGCKKCLIYDTLDYHKYFD